tara:strand:+ start:1120 stop:1374 length:255 start_codon:yes stop_codon:yes gene_type:complete
MGRGGEAKPRCMNDKCNSILSKLENRVKLKDTGENKRTSVGLICWNCNFVFLKNPYTGIITAVEGNLAVPEAKYRQFTEKIGGN